MPELGKFYSKKMGTVAPLEFLPEPVVHSTKWTTGSGRNSRGATVPIFLE